MSLEFGFAHAYEFHYSLFPWDTGSLEHRVGLAVDAIQAVGATWWRPHIPWNRVEPAVVQPRLKKQDVTDGMVADYAAGAYPGVDWSETDRWVNAVTGAGIRLHAGLGIAYVSQLPWVHRGADRVLFTPGLVDPEIYLGHINLHARAAVRRYRDRIRVWQIENELNNAFEVKWVNRWRTGKWRPWGWLTRLLATLGEAVRREDPGAVVTHNFSCDAPSLRPLYSYRKDILRWAPHLDWIGLDQYPNYLCGKKNLGENLGTLTQRVRDWLPPDKPVWVLETGIPALPGRKRFSESLQADYYASVLDSVERAGGKGVLFYCLVSQEGAPGNEWHKVRPWHSVENHWGLFRPGGTPRQAYWMLKNRYGPKPLVRN